MLAPLILASLLRLTVVEMITVSVHFDRPDNDFRMYIEEMMCYIILAV